MEACVEYERTIGNEVSFSGIALHTGNDATIKFKPAPPGTGIQFVRIDLDKSPVVNAHITNISNVVRGTNIKQGDVKIFTVEHLLAAFLGLGVDNAIVEMNASEAPVGDGSANPYVAMIREAGIVEQDVPRKVYRLDKTEWVSEDGSMIMALPCDELKITCTIAFDHPEVGVQHATITINEDTFKNEIAQSRTFCFYHEVEQLMDSGLIKGGSLDNAVVIGDETIFSKEKLRFKDEFVRHKILDLIGDLALLGSSLKAHIIAIKPGHTLNIKLAQKIYSSMIKNGNSKKKTRTSESVEEDTSMDINNILNVLPHRYPFLLVDKITKMDDKKATGIKNVTMNEPFFTGHFPGRPIMPGVLIVEAMAQLSGVMMLKKSENEGKYAYFMSIDNAKFRKTVIPGDQLRMEVELIKARSKTGKVHGKAYVDDTLVTEADLMFALVDGDE